MILTLVRSLRRGAAPLRNGLSVVAVAVAATACGGSGSSDDAAPTAAAPPASTAQTIEIRGAVVKGPVAGASVCAYAVAATGRAGALGPCATTAADGSYALSVAGGIADILLEATGGAFLDEATGQASGLPNGQAMTSLVSGQAGPVSAYITPLTTLAVNMARAGGALSAASAARAANDLRTGLGLDPALDIFQTAPVVTGTANAYGAALVAISRVVRDGIPLAELLATSNVQALGAAYRAAVAGATLPTTPTTPTTPPTPGTPGTPETPVAGGIPTATGTLAITGGSPSSFTPDASGFTVLVDGSRTTYRFERQVSFTVGGNPATSTAYIFVTRATNGLGGPLQNTILAANFTPEAGSSGFASANCSGDCGVRIVTPAGATHPVTVEFTNVALGRLVLNGSLTGDAPGAAWSTGDLPRTSTGSVSVNGASFDVLTGDVVTGSGPGGTVRSATLQLAGGAQLVATEQISPTGTRTNSGVSYLVPGGAPLFCLDCAFTLTESATTYDIAFGGTAGRDGTVFGGSTRLGRSQGTLTSPTLGSFTPVSDAIKSSNDTRTLSFNVLGTPAQGGISLVVATVKAGQVVEVSVSTGIGVGVYQCFREAASFIGIPACANARASADGRSVSFDGTALGGGTVGNQRQTATITGTLTARGL